MFFVYYLNSFSSVQFSCSVASDSLRPHELQHARPPCPSSPWCHPAISSSVVPLSSCPKSLPASESFPMSQLFAWKFPLVLLIILKRSRLSHYIVFLYFFALISEEGFLVSPCYSLECCIQMGISFLFSFAFHFSSFHLFVRPPQTNILPFCISFSWQWSWSLPPVKCHEPLSIVLQALCLSDLIPWICHSHCIIIRDLI